MMLRVYYLMFENGTAGGWRCGSAWFSMLTLRLLNLIPMPVLDGGHIVLAIMEAVRRRPVNARVLEVVQTACAVVIIGFMVYIAFFDVQDLFGRAGPKFTRKDSSALRSVKLRCGQAEPCLNSRYEPSHDNDGFELDGYRIVKNFGVVRGIIVRSRSIFGTIGAGLQTLVGGNITILTDLCEKTRQHALEHCLQHAQQLGANAVIGLRYDATEIMQGVTEVLCYGTACWSSVEPKQ